MHCNELERSALLRYARNMPESHAALFVLALGNLSESARKISGTVADIAGDFADSVIDPNHFNRIDRLTRRDGRTNAISTAAAACGSALAALDLLAAQSDAYQKDLWHMAEHSYQMSYNRLKDICYRHGYREGD